LYIDGLKLEEEIKIMILSIDLADVLGWANDINTLKAN